MKITKKECTTALSRSKLPGLTYSLNPYQGCQHNCAYCYVPNVCRIPRQIWGTYVVVKHNIINILTKELKKKTPGVVGISTVTDPYQPIEKHYQLTRKCLGQLLLHDFPVCVQTKSSLVQQDFDLLCRFSSAELMISIGTIHDAERKILEPAASSINERLRVLKLAANAGIKTSVFFGPVYPTITARDIPGIFDLFEEHHVSEILIDRLNLKPGILNSIQNQVQGQILASSFHQFLEKADSQYRSIRNEFHSLGKQRKITVRDAF